LKQQYKTYEQSKAFLYDMVAKYPNLISVQSIGKTWENRDIILATITINIENEATKPALLFTGTVHAREWIGHELSVAFVDYVLTNYNTNPNIQKILTRNTIYIVPCLNPDGFVYSQKHYSFWRKNRRDNKDGTYGVDLNRNFSVGYGKSSNTSSNVYSGPKPFSEPETRAIKEFVDNHDNITIALDYHSQGNVFFPAHNFNHESELNGTDLNTICANMNYEINKVTSRKYGIHRGKPPTKLISGSGREYYYSKGILSFVIEVGTRNIPDFMKNMSESCNENIPAVLYALSEASNYSPIAPKRVSNFHIDKIEANEITLSWDYEADKDIYFEIYRNLENKENCNFQSMIGQTYNKSFKDIQLKSSTTYYYYIRAVNNLTHTKSPFAPKIKAKTSLEADEFSKTIFPASNKVGYVASKLLETNRLHFGVNSLFIGVDKKRGVSLGVIEFSIENIPSNAIIKNVRISLYPLNRVNAKIEKYGEWSISFLDTKTVAEIFDFEQINNAKTIETLGDTIPSEQLTQGKWSHWYFNQTEKDVLSSHLKDGRLLFKIAGPSSLPDGKDSQMMMFDIGYGNFGGGIHYRPSIDIIYTVPNETITLNAITTTTIYQDKKLDNKLLCGYDENNDKIYGNFRFDLNSLKDIENIVITDCYLKIKNDSISKTKDDIRFNIEFVDIDENSYEAIKDRDRIEFIGYEVSQSDVQKTKSNKFIFDNYSKIVLQEMIADKQYANFIIKTTTSDTKNFKAVWDNDVKLVLNYIHKRQKPVDTISNLRKTVENKSVKLQWDKPTDDDFVGVFVVRNRFRKPRNPFDGDKIYAGNDNYTYDNFGNIKISKYYAVFTYDNVPNYSKPIIIEHKGEL